jgi:uncharacterized membrane protein (UPF0127 family)
MQAVNVTQNKTLANPLVVADTFLSSLIGLMGKRNFPPGQGLWILPCQSVHTMWMLFPIDVIFLDKNRVVVHCIENMKPFCLSRHVRQAKSALELPAHTIKYTQTLLGDQVEISGG